MGKGVPVAWLWREAREWEEHGLDMRRPGLHRLLHVTLPRSHTLSPPLTRELASPSPAFRSNTAQSSLGIPGASDSCSTSQAAWQRGQWGELEGQLGHLALRPLQGPHCHGPFFGGPDVKVVWHGVGTPGLATRPAEVFKFQFLLLLGEAASGPPWRMVIGADFVPRNLARLGDMIVTALEVLLMSGGLKPELF